MGRGQHAWSWWSDVNIGTDRWLDYQARLIAMVLGTGMETAALVLGTCELRMVQPRCGASRGALRRREPEGLLDCRLCCRSLPIQTVLENQKFNR